MDKVNVEKWVRALEGGRWEQGEGVLYDNSEGGYCCLGVLACVAMKKTGASGRFYLRLEADDCQNLSTFPSLRGRAGLTGHRIMQLIKLNDEFDSFGEHKNNFKEIAAWIRKNILKEKRAHV